MNLKYETMDLDEFRKEVCEPRTTSIQRKLDLLFKMLEGNGKDGGLLVDVAMMRRDTEHISKQMDHVQLQMTHELHSLKTDVKGNTHKQNWIIITVGALLAIVQAVRMILA